jgi:peptide/nickel transport system substrate-binding protein
MTLSRRTLVRALGGYGALLLAAACSAPVSPTAAPAKPAEGAAAKPAAESKPAATGPAPAAGAATAAPASGSPAAAAATKPAEAAKPAAAPAKPGAGGTLTFVLENDVIDFDPLRSRAFVDRNVHYQIYDSLVRIDATGKIVPWLAESWELSDGGKTVVFKLRKDVKYHDGTPFDAESVKWNIDRYRTTEGSARAGELSPVAGVDVVDASTVKMNLKAPFSPLLAILVDRAGMMVSRKAVEAGGADFTRKAFKAGTGPFVLTEAVKDDHITLEKNPDWWGKDKDGGKLPYLDKIVVKPITNSDVRLTNVRTDAAQVANNIAGKDVATVKNDPSLVYQEKPSYNWNSLIPNRKQGFVFNEPRYVKAVSMAIDRKEILDKVFFGVGSVGYGPVAPTHFAADPGFKPFEKPDPEGAKKLVAEVGKGPLAFEILVSAGDPVLLQRASLIQAQLAKADIKAELKQLEFAQILELQTKRTFPGLSDVGWSGRIDPDPNIYDHIYTEKPFNDSSYSNKEVDRLLDEQRQSSDEAKRKEALRKAEQIMVVDDPARIWYRFGVAQLATTKKVQGLEPYPDQIARFQYASLTK